VSIGQGQRARDGVRGFGPWLRRLEGWGWRVAHLQVEVCHVHVRGLAQRVGVDCLLASRDCADDILLDV